MDRRSRRRIWKLEKLLSKTEKLIPAVLRKREESQISLEHTHKLIRKKVRFHATAVAAIVISGEPKIDEPLEHAWLRTLAHHRINPEDLLDVEDDDGDFPTIPEGFAPAFKTMYPALVDDPDYAKNSQWDPCIVHAPEVSRFTEIFRTAPIWLLQFTHVDVDARVLKFEVPDMSAKLLWGTEGIIDAKRWPLLPRGTMTAGSPVCHGPDDFESDLSPEERRFYREMKKIPQMEWPRLEKRRMRELIDRVSATSRMRS